RPADSRRPPAAVATLSRSATKFGCRRQNQDKFAAVDGCGRRFAEYGASRQPIEAPPLWRCAHWEPFGRSRMRSFENHDPGIEMEPTAWGGRTTMQGEVRHRS